MAKSGRIKFKVVKLTASTFLVEYARSVIIETKTKGAASRIAGALNRALRETIFRPKSAGRRARSKGHGFEREVAIALRAIYPKARRHLEYQDVEANGVDLVETGPFRIQCKRLKEYAPLSRLDEIEFDDLLGEIPVLVTAADNKPALAALPLVDLIRLIEVFEGKKS